MKPNTINKIAEMPGHHKGMLSVPSRILVAFASGALLSVFFLPAWQIYLYAPQYPEGLVMNIWINNLTGDVDIINGLNHYIGMKHLSVATFPEFKFLPYVVAFFIALGLIVSITGKRKFLFAYIVLTILGGVAAILDFHRWCYNYGHHLDPTAPIQVPGMSYDPPLFGHKRLLNFDAYSYPGLAGWIVAGAGALAITVWFVEWYKEHKKAKASILIGAAASIILLFSLSSCASKPEPINYGKDICSFCKMGISDSKFGAEVITKKGKVYKFDDLHCMIMFLRSAVVEEKDINKKVVINFEKENDFIEVNAAWFVINPDLHSPMGSNAAGFLSQESAQKQGNPIHWIELFTQVK